MIRLKQRTILKFTSTLFFLFIFLNDHTFYSDFFESTGTYFLIIAVAFLALSIFVVRVISLDLRMCLVFFGWAVCVLVPCAIAGVTPLVFVRFCYWVALLIMLIVLEKADIDYRESLLFAVKILCVWCFVCYFYTQFGFDFLPVTNVSDKLLYNWYKVKLNGYLIYKNLVTFSLGGFSVIKLYSPLGEPGIACMYFNFAVIWLLFFSDLSQKENRRWVFFFSAAILLSLSMIGILVFFSVLVVYAVKERKYAVIFFLSVPIVVFSAVLIIQKLGTQSYTQRSSDYAVMFDVILKNLPFGIGLGNIDSVQKVSALAKNADSMGFYCGLLYPLVQYGVFGIVYYCMVFIAFRNFSGDRFARLAFFMYFFLTLLTQPQADECFILSFVFAGIVKHFQSDSYHQQRRKKSLVKPTV